MPTQEQHACITLSPLIYKRLQEQGKAAVKWLPAQEYTSQAILRLTVHYSSVICSVWGVCSVASCSVACVAFVLAGAGDCSSEVDASAGIHLAGLLLD
jgi:hypothetical protein